MTTGSAQPRGRNDDYWMVLPTMWCPPDLRRAALPLYAVDTGIMASDCIFSVWLGLFIVPGINPTTYGLRMNILAMDDVYWWPVHYAAKQWHRTFGQFVSFTHTCSNLSINNLKPTFRNRIAVLWDLSTYPNAGRIPAALDNVTPQCQHRYTRCQD